MGAVQLDGAAWAPLAQLGGYGAPPSVTCGTHDLERDISEAAKRARGFQAERAARSEEAAARGGGGRGSAGPPRASGPGAAVVYARVDVLPGTDDVWGGEEAPAPPGGPERIRFPIGMPVYTCSADRPSIFDMARLFRLSTDQAVVFHNLAWTLQNACDGAQFPQLRMLVMGQPGTGNLSFKLPPSTWAAFWAAAATASTC